MLWAAAFGPFCSRAFSPDFEHPDADARSYDELPENAKKYLKRIEEFTDTKISIVSVGPKRDQTMVLTQI